MSGYCNDCGNTQCLCKEIEQQQNPTSSRMVDSVVSIPLDLAEDLRDYMDEIIGERDWWSSEKRCNFQRDYNAMVATRDRVSKIIDDANAESEASQ